MLTYHFFSFSTFFRRVLINAHKTAKAHKITRGIGYLVSATIGDPIVINLPKMLHIPYAVASKTVGNSSALIR